MTDLLLAFRGFDHLLNGVMIPFCIALGACLARAAFFGWDGFKSFAANFTISFILGMGAHWLMLDTSLGGSTRAAITLGVALISKNVLDAFFSRAACVAMRDRLAFEIRHRFARPARYDADRFDAASMDPLRTLPPPDLEPEPGADTREDREGGRHGR